jgi:uncharacterized protein (DUF885 family)
VATTVATTPTPGITDSEAPEKIESQPDVSDLLASLDGLPLRQFFDESFVQLLLRDPQWLTATGLAGHFGLRNDQLTDLSELFQRETQALESGILDLLRSYDRESLAPEDQVSYDVYEWWLADQVRGHRFEDHRYTVHHFVGSYQRGLDSLFTRRHPLASREDAEDYVSRLSQVGAQVDQLLAALERSEERGVIPPRFIVELTRQDLLDYLQIESPDPALVDVASLSVYARLAGGMEGIQGLSARDREAFLGEAQAQIEDSFIPAIVRLIEHQDHLLGIATDDAGAWKLPDGEGYYAYMLRHQSTTELTPTEIHEIGQAEVARIQAELRDTLAELGYPEDVGLSAGLQQAIDDAGHHQVASPQEQEALVDLTKGLIAEAEQAMARVCDLQPVIDLEIVGGPAPVSYYLAGTPVGPRPGLYHVALGGDSHPRYRVATIAYHEAVPGHHFQIGIAMGLDLPLFRNVIGFSAFSEGWALYAERLAWELGLYENDAYGNVGRLQSELLRAARLVADTGIHAMGWTREEGRAYMDEATLLAGSFSHEVDRYVVLPGQATGYKIGMLKILELRQMAHEELGDQFDLREFHNLVLGSGSVPLDVLERIVRDYVRRAA